MTSVWICVVLFVHLTNKVWQQFGAVEIDQVIFIMLGTWTYTSLTYLRSSAVFSQHRLWLCLAILELAIIILLLILCGYACPDTFRTTLWREGGTHGWNSDPDLRIYFYANHQRPPTIPYIWSMRWAIHIVFQLKELSSSLASFPALLTCRCLLTELARP